MNRPFGPSLLKLKKDIMRTTLILFKKGYAEMMSLKVKKKIALVLDEILISGDLAVVRLQWHTTLYSDKGDILRKAVDLQIFRREDGKWKFYRGMWYHLKPTTSG
jgi:ketosteroid isomerase-like protein